MSTDVHGTSNGHVQWSAGVQSVSGCCFERRPARHESWHAVFCEWKLLAPDFGQAHFRHAIRHSIVEQVVLFSG